MNANAGIRDWLKTPAGRLVAVLCLLTGVLLGAHAWRTFVDPPPASYPVDFSGAHWIRPEGQGDTGYYRKKFYVQGRVKQAWIQVAGVDYFEFQVNGLPISFPGSSAIFRNVTGSMISAEVAVQLDLAPYLLDGENCITAYVRRRINAQGPDLLVKGMIQDGSGEHSLFSNATWKASTSPPPLRGETKWTQPYLDDSCWPLAVESGRPVPGSSLQPVAVPPAVFQQIPQGSWIGPEGLSSRTSYFRREFRVPWGAGETWLQVGATGRLSVYLNGRRISTDQWAYNDKTAGELRNMMLVPLHPQLKWGQNRLEIVAENALGENLIVGDILFVSGGRVAGVVPTDASWKAHGPSRAGGGVWGPARAYASYGDPPWGRLQKLSYLEPESEAVGFARMWKGFLLLSVTAAAWIGGCWWFGNSLARRFGLSCGEALLADALAQMVTAFAVILLFLASMDVRVPPDLFCRPAWFWMLLGFSCLLRVALWRRPPASPRRRPERYPELRRFVSDYGFGIALAAVVLLAFGIRAAGLMNFPLDHDEIFMRQCAWGILERGFPSIVIPGLFYRLTTYELLPWPQAFCATLTGWQDWSLRVPSLLFGTATCGLLGVMGSRLFNRRTGLLAALVYACLSWNVHWARHSFHLQQTQFFALACFYVFYLAIRNGNGMDRRYFAAACVLFCATYLSWEGSGFILPAFALTLVAMHPTDWRWLRQFHFWTGLVFVAAVVLVQLSSRAVTLPPYLGLGSGLSDISTPTLYFLDPNYQGSFYVDRLLRSESHFLLSCLVLLGLFLEWKHRPTRYVLVLFLALLVCYSNLLAVYSIRYSYYYQTLLVLGGCAVAVRFYDRISEACRGVSWAWVERWPQRCMAGLILLVFLAASETGLRLFRLTYVAQNPEYFFRYDDIYVDYESPSQWVARQLRPGDRVISVSPHAFHHFSGVQSYGFNPLLLKRMYYDFTQDPPAFIDRYSGTVAMRNMLELRDFYNRSGRIWMMATPFMAFEMGADRDSMSFIKGISSLVYENASGRVYLWDGGNPADVAESTPAVVPGPNGAFIPPSAGQQEASKPEAVPGTGTTPAGQRQPPWMRIPAPASTTTQLPPGGGL